MAGMDVSSNTTADAAAAANNSVGMNGKDEHQLSAAQKKKLKKKEREKAKKAERDAIRQQMLQKEREMHQKMASDKRSSGKSMSGEQIDGIDVEYVSAPIEMVLEDFINEKVTSNGEKSNGDVDGGDLVEEMKRIANHFGSVEDVMGNAEERTKDRSIEAREGAHEVHEDGSHQVHMFQSGAQGKEVDGASTSVSVDHPETDQPVSRKKLRQMKRPSIANLKQSIDRPDVVEVWDATAPDPELLVYLKAYRNTVPVPRHWSQKRHYLQGKRGLEKAPFKLPAFIEATGIGDMRQAYLEKAEAQKLKSKGRERMQPKMGKLDIDYQVLHDAFFRHQTKPSMSVYGDLYYEGKEFESGSRHARPGVLSPGLRAALGMETSTSPPPWLVAMQRYGPPPSYPSLRIPGLNSPIPSGAEFGYHPGGWGKPPVDEFGQPIYGDVFGTGGQEVDADGALMSLAEEEDAAPDETKHWGEIEDEESSEEEEESSEEEEEGSEGEIQEGMEGAAFVSGTASALPAGLETPVEVQLRKAAEEHAAAAPEHPKQLYQVLEEKSTTVGGGVMGTDHVYVVPGQTSDMAAARTDATTEKGTGLGDGNVIGAAAKRRLEALQKEAPTDFEVSINPADLEALDDESLKDLYNEKVKERRAAAGREDFSDMVAANAAVQKRKATEKAGTGSKEKKFKF